MLRENIGILQLEMHYHVTGVKVVTRCLHNVSAARVSHLHQYGSVSLASSPNSLVVSS